MDAQRATRVVAILTPSANDASAALIIREAVALRDAGADIVDLDTLPAGPFADADASTLALVLRGLGEAGIPACVTTTQAWIARIALERGARWIMDPSGTTADPDMVHVARRPSFAGWVIGPWSTGTVPHGDADVSADAYMYGLVRNLASLLAAGVASDRIILNASAGLSATARDPWLMLGQLERVRALGYPVLVDGPDEVLASITSDESPKHLADAAVGLAVLAVGAHAWGIRTRAVSRVLESVGRMIEPRTSA